MTTLKFMSHLQEQDIQVWADGDRLRYSAPEGGLTPELRAELVRRKSEILTFLRSAAAMVPALVPFPRVGALPLSFAQERLWFLDQLEPESSTYNVPGAFRLSGPLNVTALEQSLSEIINRHETLRTTFSATEGQPFQVIAPSLTLALPLVDLQELPETEREAEAQRRMSKAARRPFDLAHGPLLRASLIRLRETEHILLLTMHHIVCDAWSTGVLFRELALFYEAFVTGSSPPLEDLPIQYADYAVWQREWLQGEVLETQLTYWQEKLSGAPPSPSLPTDHPRPARQTYAGAYESLVLLPASRLQRLQALSRQEEVTLFMILLAAFEVLLHRYTGQEDIVVGTPISNRSRIQVEGLIGFFVNTLVLRTDLTGEPTFREVLGWVREVAMEAYMHQDLPFEKLVEGLQPGRDLSHSPLFQVMFVYVPSQGQPREMSGIAWRPLEVDSGTSKFDLTLFTTDEAGGLTGTLEYNTDLFEAATMQRMLGHLKTLLEGIVEDPDRQIGRLPLLAEAERYQLLVGWNDTQIEYARDGCVQHLFEAQAQRTPDAVAVQFEGEELSYRALNARANQVAHYLQRHQVGPEVVVAICIERSLEMVVGMLGILKAGGAYLPLDLSLPQERLVYMMEDAGVPVLLTQERQLPALPENRALVLCLDAEWEAIAEESEENPAGWISAENLAYLLYTSGSTGVPKGVAMHHRPLYNLILWEVQNSRLPGGARMLQFSPLSFDMSFADMFWCWASGGTSVLMAEELRRDPAGLLDFVSEQSIERVNLPVIALQQLAEAAAKTGTVLTSIGEIVTTAEQLQITPPIVELFDSLLECPLHNQYGPTETHVVTGFTLEGAPAGWPPLPSIGQPIANTQIYLLDGSLQPVPVGVTGDLYIGGDSLARGYLNRPELTAEKFLPSPFSNVPGARLYRTGDLARYLPDGNIEFLGRSDHQVKIRGFRVELGEIEAVLGRHPGVQEAVVVVREGIQGDKRLVAYVVPDGDRIPAPGDLRGFLQEKLPDYMVPAVYVMLESLPLTPSGKVARIALPAPDWSKRELEEVFVAPRTPTEEVLAGIWAEILGIERVGVYDNFFELGGHSLLATQVISRARQALPIEVPLRAIFEAPTVAGLARAIIAHESTPGQTDQMAQILRSLESMPAEEVRKMLQERESA